MEAREAASREGTEDRSPCSNSCARDATVQTTSDTEAGTLLSLLLAKLTSGPYNHILP